MDEESSSRILTSLFENLFPALDIMPFNTATAGAAVMPAVIKTFLSHVSLTGAISS
jgi:hypothetical protein